MAAADTRGMSRKIRDAVITILKTVQYEGEPAFADVLDNTKSQFEGYPTLVLLPNGLQSEDGDTADKDHTVRFVAFVHWLLQDSEAIESNLFNSMLDITDLTINAIEHADRNGGLTDVDPDIPDWRMNSTDAQWITGQSKAGALLICRLNIEVTYSQFLG